MALDSKLLQKSFRKLRKVLQHPSKISAPEDVHKLRTQTRRAEAIVHSTMLDRKREGARLLKVLAPVRKAAGKVRDMDVLVGFSSSLAGDSQDQCLVQLLEHLGSRRFKAAAKLHKTIAKDQKEARRSLKRCYQRIEKELDRSSKKAQASPNLSTNAMALSLELAAELSKWPKLTSENLHPYRLKVKELRYILQVAQGSSSQFVEALGEVKDRIGEWHDWNDLAAIADKVLEDGAACKVSKQIRQRVKEEFDKALIVTNAMRMHYLNGQQRQPVRASVVKAASRLAA